MSWQLLLSSVRASDPVHAVQVVLDADEDGTDAVSAELDVDLLDVMHALACGQDLNDDPAASSGPEPGPTGGSGDQVWPGSDVVFGGTVVNQDHPVVVLSPAAVARVAAWLDTQDPASLLTAHHRVLTRLLGGPPPPAITEHLVAQWADLADFYQAAAADGLYVIKQPL